MSAAESRAPLARPFVLARLTKELDGSPWAAVLERGAREDLALAED